MLKLIRQISKKPRMVGTEQYNIIRDILIKKLELIGYKTRVQKIKFTGGDIIEKPKLKINNKNVNVLPVLWSSSGKIKGTLK